MIYVLRKQILLKFTDAAKSQSKINDNQFLCNIINSKEFIFTHSFSICTTEMLFLSAHRMQTTFISISVICLNNLSQATKYELHYIQLQFSRESKTLYSLWRASSMLDENFEMVIEFECNIYLLQEYKLPYNYQIIQHI